MASTERSLGWATSGTGDGPLAGYDSSRWRANAQKTDGTGTTLFGSYLAMSGTTTSTLTIADGAAIINGYTYETAGSVTISTSGLTGTYSVAVIANSAAAQTVTANGAGTTTVAQNTTRAAIVTAAQLSTIQGAVGSAQTLVLGTVVVTAGVISSITPAYPYSTSLQVPAQVYAVLDSPSPVAVANVTSVDITGYGISSTSGEGIISVNTSTGVMTVALAGVYHVEARCTWDANTTGNRRLDIVATSVTYTMDGSWQQASGALVGNAAQVTTGSIFLGAGATVKAQAYQTSGGSRQVLNAILKLVRL
jgi:hypothetical protein